MKRLVVLSTLLSLLFVTLSFSQDKKAPAEGIHFFKGTLVEAQALAKKENKLVFVDAYASWCGPCKIMAAQVFPQKAVGDFFNENFISVKLDCEKNAEGPGFARKYGVRAYPTLFFLDGDGTVVHKALGMHRTDDFISLGEQAQKKKS